MLWLKMAGGTGGEFVAETGLMVCPLHVYCKVRGPVVMSRILV